MKILPKITKKQLPMIPFSHRISSYNQNLWILTLSSPTLASATLTKVKANPKLNKLTHPTSRKTQFPACSPQVKQTYSSLVFNPFLTKNNHLTNIIIPHYQSKTSICQTWHSNLLFAN